MHQAFDNNCSRLEAAKTEAPERTCAKFLAGNSENRRRNEDALASPTDGSSLDREGLAHSLHVHSTRNQHADTVWVALPSEAFVRRWCGGQMFATRDQRTNSANYRESYDQRDDLDLPRHEVSETSLILEQLMPLVGKGLEEV